jgi:hypothetical protein
MNRVAEECIPRVFIKESMIKPRANETSRSTQPGVSKGSKRMKSTKT